MYIDKQSFSLYNIPKPFVAYEFAFKQKIQFYQTILYGTIVYKLGSVY